MPDNPNAPFGENTIEGAFLQDVDFAFDHDDTAVTVSVTQPGDEMLDQHEIGLCNLDILREPAGSTTVQGTKHEVVEIVYELTVPVELAVAVGDIVEVDGFESTWSFEPVDGVRVTDGQTSVIARDIRRSYGDTSEPEFDNE